MKQAILVRNDLKMPKGKMSAQSSHASVEAVLKSDKEKINEWKKDGMMKVVLKVDNEKELLKYNQQAKDSGLITAMITDAGKTFFKEPTKTCLAIGPDKEEKIDKVTGKLKLIN
ncbi:peptidyl-tRNA hydrolase Pth2 [Candidatus Woesearchaeota archaeon]|nr:peptidyl-tRNA hydrolase Pth2 [Candidatus Woesearchaeota archaeon]